MTHPDAGLRRALLVLTVFVTLVAGLGTTVEPASAAAYRTTANLNLRTGPGTSYDVIRVIPSGATVEVTGDAQGGYLPVTYSGSSGFAAADFLTSGSGSDPGSGTTSGPTGTRYVVDGRLNLRSGPGTTYGVILVLQDGSSVQLTGEVSGSYSKVTYNGTTGWVATQYLSESAGSTPPPATEPPPATSDGGSVAIGDTVTGTARTTARLNLRRGPGTGYTPILTMPSGATVDVMGTSQSGFLPVRYNGTKGWASADYLSTGGTSAPTPTPTQPPAGDGGSVPVGDTVTGSATTTVRLNLRRGPGTDYAVILTMASGASVEVMGTNQNGFTPVRYNGTRGWASAQFLTTGGSTSPTPTPTTPPSGDGDSVPVGDTVSGSAITTARLNLRRGPGTTYGVILTMANGATVDVMGANQNGFTPVRYNGTKGWASADYLTTGGTTDPGGNDGDSGEDMITTRSVNMRSAPNTTSSVVWVLPPGTLIDVTGAPQNGYYPANWAHVSGYVHGDYLIPESQWSDPGGGSTRDQEMIAIIYQAADKWGQSRTDMLRVARCESALDPNAVNPRSGTSGLFQFRPSTFAITPNGKRGENIFDPWSNADAAGWMWANGMRNHWACQ